MSSNRSSQGRRRGYCFPDSMRRWPARSRGRLPSRGHIVVSNARNYRMEPDVPLLVPEINADHLQLLTTQAMTRSWKGRIVTNPNCSTIVLTMALGPLRQFWASSGERHHLAGRVRWRVSRACRRWTSSGTSSRLFGGEEEKMETETKKILGELKAERVEPHQLAVSAHTHAGAGHQRSHRRCSRSASIVSRRSTISCRPFATSRAGRKTEKLPSAPPQPIVYLEQRDRPQPRLDVDRGGGDDRDRWAATRLLGARLQAGGARSQHDPRRGGRGGF